MSTTKEDTTVRLTYREKVPISLMKETIANCLQEKLSTTPPLAYDGEKCNDLSKSLADNIRNKLKSLNYDRYKYIVQVVIGERREQGVRMGTRCFWDVGTDNQASETFLNVSIILYIIFIYIYFIFYIFYIG
jgi:hypothetical protein